MSVLEELNIALEYLSVCRKINNAELELTPEQKSRVEKGSRCFEECLKRIENKDTKQDKFYESVKYIAGLVCHVNSPEERNFMYLKQIGVEMDKPYLYLFDSKDVVKSKKYVLVNFIDYASPDDEYGHSRNGGEPERFYGSGKSTTLRDFAEEINRQYNGCWWTHIADIQGPFMDDRYVVYKYCGRLYKVREDEPEDSIVSNNTESLISAPEVKPKVSRNIFIKLFKHKGGKEYAR